MKYTLLNNNKYKLRVKFKKDRTVHNKGMSVRVVKCI